MMTPYVEGDTEQIIFELLSDGEVPAEPLTGTLVLTLTNALGVVISTSGKTAIVSGALWRVGYTPAAGDILASGGRHTYHWSVTQGGVDFSFPGGNADGIEPFRR